MTSFRSLVEETEWRGDYSVMGGLTELQSRDFSIWLSSLDHYAERVPDFLAKNGLVAEGGEMRRLATNMKQNGRALQKLAATIERVIERRKR